MTLVFPFLPSAALSPNSRAHYQAKGRAAKQLRADTYLYAKQQTGPLDLKQVAVTLQVRCKNPNQRRDIDNYQARLKPFFDGLVDARILADDSWRVLQSIAWADPPFVAGDDAIVLEIQEVLK